MKLLDNMNSEEIGELIRQIKKINLRFQRSQNLIYEKEQIDKK